MKNQREKKNYQLNQKSIYKSSTSYLVYPYSRPFRESIAFRGKRGEGDNNDSSRVRVWGHKGSSMEKHYRTSSGLSWSDNVCCVAFGLSDCCDCKSLQSIVLSLLLCVFIQLLLIIVLSSLSAHTTSCASN